MSSSRARRQLACFRCLFVRLQLTQQGLPEDEAGELLEKSFGWRGQARGLFSTFCQHCFGARLNPTYRNNGFYLP